MDIQVQTNSSCLLKEIREGEAEAKRLETRVPKLLGYLNLFIVSFSLKKNFFVDFCSPQGIKLVNVLLLFRKLKEVISIGMRL